MGEHTRTTASRSTPDPPAGRKSSMWHFGTGEVTVILACALAAVWTTIVWWFRSGNRYWAATSSCSTRSAPRRVSAIGRSSTTGPPFTPCRSRWFRHLIRISIRQPILRSCRPSTRPLSLLSFPVAYACGLLFSSVMYGGLIAIAARGCVSVSRRHVLMACLLFPPFVAHQTIGQSTIWPLLGFVSGWWALTQSRPFAAGLMLSVVAIKPHLGMALAIVLLTMRLWRIVGGVLLGSCVSGRHHCRGVRTGRGGCLPHDDAPCPSRHDSHRAQGREVYACAPNELGVPGPARSGNCRLACRKRLVRMVGRERLAPQRGLGAPNVCASACDAVDQPSRPGIRRHPVGASDVVACLLGGIDQTGRGHGWDLSVLAVAFVVPSARLWGIPLTLPLMGWLLWRCQASEAWKPPNGKIVAQGDLASVVA